MTEQQGFIKLFRKCQSNDLFNQKPYDKWHAWEYLLLNAQYKDGQIMVNNQVIETKRGCVYQTQANLATSWGWSRGKVLRFISSLEKMEMISVKNEHENDTNNEQKKEQLTVQHKKSVITCISILNFDKYQQNGTTDETQVGTIDDTTVGTLIKNIKNIKNIKKDISSLESDFSATFLFENVWDFYGKKGNKKTAKGRYEKLSKKDKIAAVLYIPYYHAFTVPQYRKGFEVYISRRQWDNLLQDCNGKIIPFFDTETGSIAYHVANIDSFKVWFNNLVRGTSIKQVQEVTPDRQMNLNICYTLYPKLMEKAVRTVMTSQRYVEMANKGMITFDYIFNPANIIKICEQGEELQ